MASLTLRRLALAVLVFGWGAPAAHAVNSPPYTDLIHPPNNTLLNEGDNVRLEANATDPDGTVLKVEFYLDGGWLGDAAPAPFRLWWTNAALGSHTLRAVAVDDSLARSTSFVAIVTVEPPVARALIWSPPVTTGAEWNMVTANWRFNGRPALFHSGDTVSITSGFSATNFIGLDGVPMPVSPAATLLLSGGEFRGGDVLTGSLEHRGFSTCLFSNYSGSLSFPGGTIIAPSTSGALTYDVSLAPNNASLHFGTGPILTAGGFSFQPGSNRVAILENDFVVTNVNTASIAASWRPGTVSRFTGRLNLGWALNFQLQSSSFGAPAVDAIEWAGPIILDQSRPLPPFSGPKINVMGNYTPRSVVLSGNISDGPGTASNRFRLQGYAVPVIRLSGTNTYTRGTTIESSPSAPQVIVEVEPQSSLGEGDLEVQSNGYLRLMGSRNLRQGAHANIQGRVALEPGVKIRLRSLTLGSSNFTTGLFTGTNPPGSFYSLYLRSNGTFRLPATNLPPVVALTNPVHGANYAPGTNLVLRAAASDADSYIARAEFRMNGSLLGVRTNAPYQLTLREVPAGAYTFQALAYDDDGGVSSSSVVAITLQPQIKNITFVPGSVSSMRVDFDSIVNQSLTLQATTPLTPGDWTNLFTFPPATMAAPMSYFDFEHMNFGERYYRLRVP